MDNNESDGHILRRWVSMGDLIVLLSTLAVFSFGYGRLSRDVEALSVAMHQMEMRDITPGAREQIASIQATDKAMQAQIDTIRIEMRENHKETMEAIAGVSAELAIHSRIDK